MFARAPGAGLGPWTGSALLYRRSDPPLIAALLPERNQILVSLVDHLLQPVFERGQEHSRVSGVVTIALQVCQSSLLLNDPQHAFRDVAVDFQQMIFLAMHYIPNRHAGPEPIRIRRIAS